MSRKPTNETQFTTFRREWKKGPLKTWLPNAMGRAQRRKNAWNLLPALGWFPLWCALIFLLVWLSAHLYAAIHPDALPLLANGPLRVNTALPWAEWAAQRKPNHGSLRLCTALVLFPSMIATISPALMLINWITRLIPPARRALDAEAQTVTNMDASYAASQRGVLTLGLLIAAVCAPLWLIGMMLA